MDQSNIFITSDIQPILERLTGFGLSDKAQKYYLRGEEKPTAEEER